MKYPLKIHSTIYVGKGAINVLAQTSRDVTKFVIHLQFSSL